MSKRKELTFEELRAKYAHLSEGMFYQQLEVERWMDRNSVRISVEEFEQRLKASRERSNNQAA